MNWSDVYLIRVVSLIIALFLGVIVLTKGLLFLQSLTDIILLIIGVLSLVLGLFGKKLLRGL
jgi:uncharacterized membrane protein